MQGPGQWVQRPPSAPGGVGGLGAGVGAKPSSCPSTALPGGAGRSWVRTRSRNASHTNTRTNHQQTPCHSASARSQPSSSRLRGVSGPGGAPLGNISAGGSEPGSAGIRMASSTHARCSRVRSSSRTAATSVEPCTLRILATVLASRNGRIACGGEAKRSSKAAPRGEERRGGRGAVATLVGSHGAAVAGREGARTSVSVLRCRASGLRP